MDIKELRKMEFPDDIVDIWLKSGFEKLLPIQVEAIEKGLFHGQNLLVVAPTSSGKTFIGEMASIQHSYNSKKSLYLVPFKAVAKEKYEEFTEKYSEHGFTIRISDKDHREDDEDIRIGNFNLAILTYEKLSGMLVANPTFLSNCDCVIVDEVQMIGDPQRGGTLELLLTKINESYSNIQIIALSAVLGNLNDFDKWLNAEVIQVTERPVELRQGVLFTNGVFEYKEWNTNLLGEEHIGETNLNGLIKFLLEQNEQVIIIKNSVPTSQRLALDLSSVFSHLPAASKIIGDLQDEPDSETRDDLLKTLRSSIAFHNADCEFNERRLIERGFRDGHIKVVVSTTTLSMGVNLPCKTVILADHEKYGSENGTFKLVNWSVGEVRNIFGRAGRLGRANEFGRGIFLAKNSFEKERIKRTYLNAPLESLVSVFENRDLSLRVLDVVASGFGNSQEEIVSFIFKTFAAKTWTNEAAIEQIQSFINKGIDKCITYELFEQSIDGNIKITEIGKICASMGCKIESIVSLKEYLETIEELDLAELIFVVSKTEEVNKGYYRGIKWDSQILRKKISDRLIVEYSNGEMTGAYLTEYDRLNGNSPSDFQLKSFVFVLLTKDILLTDNSMSLIKSEYGFSTALIRNITDNINWILDIVGKIAAIIRPQFIEYIEKINNSIMNKSTIKCYYLNNLSGLLHRDEKIRLVNSGFISMDDFLEKEATEFIKIISPAKADKIIKSINDRRERNSQYWKSDHIRRMEKLGLDTEVIKNVYSAKGTDLEHEVCRLLETKFLNCVVSRITEQRKGEPDILMLFNDGEKFAIQVTAKEDNNKFIDSKKAGDVISQSARLNPSAYICLGRPDFQDLAIEHSMHLGKIHNYKLLPLYSLVELYVRVKEGVIDSDIATSFVKNHRGYLNITEINNYHLS